MASTKNLEDLEDCITGEKVPDLVNKIKRIISLEDAPCFIMGYLACKDETFREACDYIRDKLNISKNNVKEVELEREMADLRHYFLKNISEFNNLEGEIVMVNANGFEKLWRLQFVRDQVMAAHYYDQDVIEEQEKTYKDLKKKVLVVTHIGYSLGEEGFEKAAASAGMSQFKRFFYELT